MNYCTKCASYYQTPGTCNCYAQFRPWVNPPPYIGDPPPYQPWIAPSGTTVATGLKIVGNLQ